ncbi:MAG: SH3 domain-containing protein [Proteobacteria bacterium]|nr:SH3 domain-containing protein [Pseudomonadota bacterium]
MTGRSVAIDPRHNAVRPDLADVRLAEYVFAPHYAAPMPCVVTRTVVLHAESSPESEALVELQPGETFECLEVLREVAWGVSPDRRLSGYVDRDALDQIT